MLPCGPEGAACGEDPTPACQAPEAGCREAACRLALGRAAAAFLDAKGPHHLGFARLGDYTRERLGISAREVRTLARVASALDDLPRVRAAFAAGRMSWTKVRLLVDVACADSQAFWLRQAEKCTATELGDLIRRTNPRAEPRLSASSGPAGAAAGPAADSGRDLETIDGGSGCASRAIAIPSSSATAGAAPSPPARRGATCTTTTCATARMGAATSARTG